MKNDIFDKISRKEALEILRQITKTDKNLKKKIIELVKDLFSARHLLLSSALGLPMEKQ